MEDRRDVLITLVGDVGSNYINLRGFQQQIDIARKNLEAQKHNADIIQKRHDAGFVGGLDVANAKAQVATTEATIPIFESSARAAIYSLGVLLGREPAALEKDLIKAGSDSSHPAGGSRGPALRPAPAPSRHPPGRSPAPCRHGPHRGGHRRPVPQVFPDRELRRFQPVTLTKLGNLANSKFWSFGPSVTWPIFAGGRLWWNVKVQDALAEQALLTYQKTVLTALKDVETALVAYAKQQETRKSLSEAVVNNRKAVELAMTLYLAGKSDFLNVTHCAALPVYHRRRPGPEHPHRGYQPDRPLQGPGRRLGKYAGPNLGQTAGQYHSPRENQRTVGADRRGLLKWQPGAPTGNDLSTKKGQDFLAFCLSPSAAAAVDLPLLASIQEQQGNRGSAGTAIDHLVHPAAVGADGVNITLSLLYCQVMVWMPGGMLRFLGPVHLAADPIPGSRHQHKDPDNHKLTRPLFAGTFH